MPRRSWKSFENRRTCKKQSRRISSVQQSRRPRPFARSSNFLRVSLFQCIHRSSNYLLSSRDVIALPGSVFKLSRAAQRPVTRAGGTVADQLGTVAVSPRVAKQPRELSGFEHFATMSQPPTTGTRL